MIDFETWWNSSSADEFRRLNDDMDGRVVRPVWDAAIRATLSSKKATSAAPSPEATQPTQAEAPSEREAREMQEVADKLREAGYHSAANNTERTIADIKSGNMPRAVIGAALATQQAVQGEAVLRRAGQSDRKRGSGMTTPTEQPEAQAMSHVVKEHDPHHPYVRRFIGCGHGVLFTDYCKDCEIVAVQEQYKNAIRTVQRCRNELRRLGVSLPGQTSLPVHQPVHERDVCPTCEALARTVMLDQAGKA